MAKPPEPIEEVLPQATFVVDAEVVEVLRTGAALPKPQGKDGATSLGARAPSQQVKLKVRKVLKGQAVTELVVTKPEAGYALKAGNQGPFLVDANHTILGRYGPDSWNIARIEQALTRAR
jgi:hypothetical protein